MAISIVSMYGFPGFFDCRRLVMLYTPPANILFHCSIQGQCVWRVLKYWHETRSCDKSVGDDWNKNHSLRSLNDSVCQP